MCVLLAHFAIAIDFFVPPHRGPNGGRQLSSSTIFHAVGLRRESWLDPFGEAAAGRLVWCFRRLMSLFILQHTTNNETPSLSPSTRPLVEIHDEYGRYPFYVLILQAYRSCDMIGPVKEHCSMS